MPEKPVDGGANANSASFNTFPVDRTGSFKLWVGEEGRDNRRKKKERERHEAVRRFHSRIAQL